MPTPPDDVLLNKAAIIERCIRRLGEEARACPGYDDFTHVDALTLNIERACQAGRAARAGENGATSDLL